MAGIENGIRTITSYAKNDKYGYTLYSGRHATYDFGTDCAGLARMYAAAVEGVSLNSYLDFGTWNEKAVLTGRGWTAIAFSRSKMKRGDILLRALGDSSGHTVVYIGNNQIIGAEGNWDGRPGDSSGTEICVRSYYDFSYNWILRPPSAPEVPKVSIETVKNGIYRIYNPNNTQHHFTANHNEAETLVDAGWIYEGAPFKSASSGVQLYRVYNPFSGEHLYVKDHEAAELAIIGWVIESYAWVAPKSGTEVHRFFNGTVHHYASDPTEIASLKDWIDEGVAFYTN